MQGQLWIDNIKEVTCRRPRTAALCASMRDCRATPAVAVAQCCCALASVVSSTPCVTGREGAKHVAESRLGVEELQF